MAEHEQVALGPRRTVAPTVEVERNAAHRVDDEAPVARRVEKQLLRGEGIEHGATDDLRLRVTAGAAPQYFEPAQLPKARQAAPLQAWAAELRGARSHAEHPLQWALWLEALGVGAQAALRQACRSSP